MRTQLKGYTMKRVLSASDKEYIAANISKKSVEELSIATDIHLDTLKKYLAEHIDTLKNVAKITPSTPGTAVMTGAASAAADEISKLTRASHVIDSSRVHRR